MSEMESKCGHLKGARTKSAAILLLTSRQLCANDCMTYSLRDTDVYEFGSKKLLDNPVPRTILV